MERTRHRYNINLPSEQNAAVNRLAHERGSTTQSLIIGLLKFKVMIDDIRQEKLAAGKPVEIRVGEQIIVPDIVGIKNPSGHISRKAVNFTISDFEQLQRLSQARHIKVMHYLREGIAVGLSIMEAGKNIPEFKYGPSIEIGSDKYQYIL